MSNNNDGYDSMGLPYDERTDAELEARLIAAGYDLDELAKDNPYNQMGEIL